MSRNLFAPNSELKTILFLNQTVQDKKVYIIIGADLGIKRYIKHVMANEHKNTYFFLIDKEKYISENGSNTFTKYATNTNLPLVHILKEGKCLETIENATIDLLKESGKEIDIEVNHEKIKEDVEKELELKKKQKEIKKFKKQLLLNELEKIRRMKKKEEEGGAVSD